MLKGEESKSIKNNDDCYQISDEDELEDEILLGDSSTKPTKKSANNSDNSVQVFIRGPYERAWTTEATRALIHIRGPMEDKFNEGRQQRTILWLLVTKQLHKLGYRYNPAKVQKKWHNILITYNKNTSKNGYVHWEFYEEMNKYLEGKRPLYDRNGGNNENSNSFENSEDLGGGEECYQFQQQLIESDEPIDYPNGENGIYDNQSKSEVVDYENDDDVVDNIIEHNNKKFKFNNDNDNNNSNNDTNTIGYSQQLPLEISNVRGGTEIPSELIGNVSTETNDDKTWWKNYFNRKLEYEQEKIQLQKDMHRDQMNFNKMSLMQQEKIERIKIDAINNLTTTLQKLVENKNNKKL